MRVNSRSLQPLLNALFILALLLPGFAFAEDPKLETKSQQSALGPLPTKNRSRFCTGEKVTARAISSRLSILPDSCCC